MKRFILPAVAVLALVSVSVAHAEDWPDFRGEGRTGLWYEEGTIDEFPEDGLKILWRMPVNLGMSGPSVADGRVFLTDLIEESATKGTERAMAFDEQTGEVLWTYEWPVNYARDGITMMPWGGPTATPTVDEDRVYILGRTGLLFALNAVTGDLLWQQDFADFKSDSFGNGTSAHPLIEGDLVICFVGGDDGANIVAFDKLTGEEVWRALELDSPLGGSAPVVITAAGIRQLLIWHTGAVVSMNPATGEPYWEVPFQVYSSVNPGIPVTDENFLMVSTFNLGSMMMRLNQDRPAAEMIWRAPEWATDVDTTGLHALFSPPILKDGVIYGICSYGQLRAVDAASGERIWETQDAMGERARFSSAFLVRVAGTDKYFINNDRGDLIIARLTPEGYEELDRTELLPVTTRPYNRRRLDAVQWMHPAYANGNIYARNDEEIIAASLTE